MTTENILGFSIRSAPPEAVLRELCEWLEKDDGPRWFACANPHSLHVAASDPVFADAIHAADMVTADGAGIVLASRLLGGSIPHRITGSDVFEGVCHYCNQQGGRRFFFLGSTPATLADIQRKMRLRYPNIEVAGVYAPPFKADFDGQDNEQMISRINAARVDILWVGLTAPKQEKWVFENSQRLEVRMIGPVGAVFDFFTGRVKRSPRLFQRLGLEWLPRLLQEPRRLWYRNFVSSPMFLLRVFQQRLRRDSK